MKRPAVGLDSDLLVGKRHVDLVSAHGMVRLPSGHVVVAQQLDQQAFGLDRAPSDAASSSRLAVGDPYRPLLRRCARQSSRSSTWRCSAESISAVPPRCRTAASTTVSGRAVTCRRLRSTMSTGCKSLRRSRDPGRARPLLSRGTVTSTMSGANLVRPCHHAAVRPLAEACLP